jgi:hypothetical protein
LCFYINILDIRTVILGGDVPKASRFFKRNLRHLQYCREIY